MRFYLSRAERGLRKTHKQLYKINILYNIGERIYCITMEIDGFYSTDVYFIAPFAFISLCCIFYDVLTFHCFAFAKFRYTHALIICPLLIPHFW